MSVLDNTEQPYGSDNVCKICWWLDKLLTAWTPYCQQHNSSINDYNETLIVIMCIRMLGFGHQKCSFRCIISFSAQKCARKVYLDWVWKWNRLRAQNSAPENRCASLHNVKVIKMSRLTINRFLILWSLHGLLRCCETECTTFLSLTNKALREDNSYAPETAPETHAFFNCAYPFALKFCCLRRTESARINLISASSLDSQISVELDYVHNYSPLTLFKNFVVLW